MMEAAVAAAMAAMSNMDVSRRKQELPSFDTKNIDLWIKRVEAAYARASITKAKEKFAFLESKIGVDVDVKINEYLFGEATEAKWTEFLAYLRNRYGRSVRQQCASILDGVPRDGRRPSEMLAHIKDKAGTITLDDIFKEMVIRSLPTEVQRTIADKTDRMSADQAVELADLYFDKDGQPIHNTPSASVAVVEEQAEVENESESVNYVNRTGKGRPNSHMISQKTSWKKPMPNAAYPPRQNSTRPKSRLTTLCFAHANFGDKAYSCEEGCQRFGQPLAKRPSNPNAGKRA